MRLDNLRNYGGVEGRGAFSAVSEPLSTRKGAKVVLVSNYAGLYGVAYGDRAERTVLSFITDNYQLAQELLAEIIQEH